MKYVTLVLVLQVTRLPDTLCIHLKRFRHDFAFSSKISTRVSFPLSGLDMSTWLHSSISPTRSSTFSLSGVVCHHGTAGGGHHTCYCYHPPTDSWYEYDDSIVREVDRQTVLNSEAYVLFYRKESLGKLVLCVENCLFISIMKSWTRPGGRWTG